MNADKIVAVLSDHWPEYLIEAAGLGLLMASACFFGTILVHPDFSLRQAIADPFIRRILRGLAMGLAAVAIIYSPWGQRSGAHINPAITLTFLRLGKLEPIDALFYVVSQFIDGAAGVFIMTFSLGSALADPHVNYLVTVPGHLGAGVAFAAEAIIPFGLMFVALAASNHVRMTRFTGLIVGVLVAAYIAFEAPLSGMSMNPARTMGSALSAWAWRGIWIYFAAPLLGDAAGIRTLCPVPWNPRRTLREVEPLWTRSLHFSLHFSLQLSRL